MMRWMENRGLVWNIHTSLIDGMTLASADTCDNQISLSWVQIPYMEQAGEQ